MRRHHRHDPNAALAGSTGARPTQSIVLRVAKVVYRCHFDPPTPSWDRAGRAVHEFFTAQAKCALAAITLARRDPDRRANLVNEVASAIYDAHRRADTPIWDRSTPQIRTWVAAQAVAVIAALADERLLIQHRRSRNHVIHASWPPR